MHLNKKGLNNMITTFLVVIVVVASVTILWSFMSIFFTSADVSGNSAFANFLSLLSPKEKDTAPEIEFDNPIVYNLLCNDTDSLDGFQDIEIFILGNATIFNETYSLSYSDKCLQDNSTLLEYYCFNNTMNLNQTSCEGENSCSEGKCEVGNLNYRCYDSDSDVGFQDNEKFKSGNLTLFNDQYDLLFNYPDSCINESFIFESFCVNSTSGEYSEIECGVNSNCNNDTGACTCGNIRGGVCCPNGIGLEPCVSGLICNSSNVCVSPPPQTTGFCGDGVIIEGNEVCDDGNTISCSPYPNGCKDDCSRRQYCGNDIIECGEECDDGNDNNNDYCKNDCTNHCPDGQCNFGEYCGNCPSDCGSCDNDGGLPCQELGEPGGRIDSEEVISIQPGSCAV